MISMHQSQFLPWIPYFYKMAKSDIFVILDDAQFEKNGVQNRNMIKTPKGTRWLTVPVKSDFGAPINRVESADTARYEKITETLRMNYSRGLFFNSVHEPLKAVFDKKHRLLHNLNMDLLDAVSEMAGARPEIRLSSSLGIGSGRDDRIIEIAKHLGETDYLSGPGAMAYMDMDKFRRAGIDIYVTDFRYSEYPQLWNKETGFLPDLSIVDLLFNNLDNAKEYIIGNGSVRKVT